MGLSVAPRDPCSETGALFLSFFQPPALRLTITNPRPANPKPPPQVYLRASIDVCGREPRLTPITDTQSVLLIGHSRGAKMSALAAAQDARVKGLALIDPVDSSSMGPSGPGYPSALPALRAAAAARRLPVLVVGAGANGDVVEAAANWSNFTRAAAGGGAPTWEVKIESCGHLQFLDKQVGVRL